VCTRVRLCTAVQVNVAGKGPWSPSWGVLAAAATAAACLCGSHLLWCQLPLERICKHGCVTLPQEKTCGANPLGPCWLLLLLQLPVCAGVECETWREE